MLSSEAASHVPLRQYRHSSRSFVLLLRFHSVSTPVGECIIRSFELFSSSFFSFYSFTALIYYTSRRAPQLRRGASGAYDAWPWQASQSTFTNSGSVPPNCPLICHLSSFFGVNEYSFRQSGLPMRACIHASTCQKNDRMG